MEQEEIIRKLNKLETNQQKDRSKIAVLQKQLTGIENVVAEVNVGIAEMGGDFTQFKTQMGRFQQIDDALTKIRVDLNKAIENIEKQRADHDREVAIVRLGDMEALNKAISEFRNGSKSFKELEKVVQERSEKETKLEKLIVQLEKRVDASAPDQQNIKMIEETLRQDAKRITSIQSEITAIRKRTDEQMGRLDLVAENIRKLEFRLNEFQQGENDRRQNFNAAIEKQNLQQLERDQLWKEWQSRFEAIDASSRNIEDQAKILDETLRSLKKAQTSFEEINQRLDRRINEVTEMQRLTDERIRQEWQVFKGDDQKRWTTYTLGQEELQRELKRQLDKSQSRIMELEDLTQEVKDMMSLMSDENKKRFQKLIDISNEWLESNERAFGRHK